jgi:uncharacterized protein YbjT (DUF2867 family)
MENKTSIATIIGATGLIGSHILKQLCADSTFSEIRVVVRRPFEYPDAKVKIVVLKFADADALRDAVSGSDVVFCAIGTTRSQTPDLQEYRKVDLDIPVNTALISEATGVRSFQLVSSIGANAQSSNFYLQIKGEVEVAVAELQIPSINIFRPSLLLGERSKPRLAEKIAAVLMKPFYFLIPDKQKPIEATCVARAMIQAAKLQKPGVNVYHYTEMMQSL